MGIAGSAVGPTGWRHSTTNKLAFNLQTLSATDANQYIADLLNKGKRFGWGLSKAQKDGASLVAFADQLDLDFGDTFKDLTSPTVSVPILYKLQRPNFQVGDQPTRPVNQKLAEEVDKAQKKMRSPRFPRTSEALKTKARTLMDRLKRHKRDIGTSTAVALIPVNSNDSLSSAYGSELVQARSKRLVNTLFFDIPITAAIAFKVDLVFVASTAVSDGCSLFSDSYFLKEIQAPSTCTGCPKSLPTPLPVKKCLVPPDVFKKSTGGTLMIL